MFFNKRAGDSVAVNEEEGALFIGIPDTVRLPPELGGKELKVVSGFWAPFRGTVCWHLELEGGYYVVELQDKFYWLKK